MESGAVARRGGNSNVAHGFGVQNSPLDGAEAQAGHHRVEGSHRRRLVGAEEHQGEQCVSSDENRSL